ncbi:helix-turn-helix transcriptional regulator [Haloferax elongans]
MSNRTEDDTQSSVQGTERTESDSRFTAQRLSPRSPIAKLSRRLCKVVLFCLGLISSRTSSKSKGESVSATKSEAEQPQTEIRSDTPGRDQSGNHFGSGPNHVEGDSDHPLLGVNPELLNPERRILQLLHIEGGSLEQSALVEHTRWSESTISRTLCRMETQERIERHRQGNGKRVFLPQSRGKPRQRVRSKSERHRSAE